MATARRFDETVKAISLNFYDSRVRCNARLSLLKQRLVRIPVRLKQYCVRCSEQVFDDFAIRSTKEHEAFAELGKTAKWYQNQPGARSNGTGAQ